MPQTLEKIITCTEIRSEWKLLDEFWLSGTGNGQFNNPADVAVDSNNNIFVTDSSNNRVYKNSIRMETT